MRCSTIISKKQQNAYLCHAVHRTYGLWCAQIPKKEKPASNRTLVLPFSRGRRTRTLNKGFGDPRVTITPCPYESATSLIIVRQPISVKSQFLFFRTSCVAPCAPRASIRVHFRVYTLPDHCFRSRHVSFCMRVEKHPAFVQRPGKTAQASKSQAWTQFLPPKHPYSPAFHRLL